MAVDLGLRVILWNPAAERLFGWTEAEMLGRVPGLVPDELKAERNAVLERVRDGVPISFSTRRLTRSGRQVDVRVDANALHDEDGEVIGWVGVYHQHGEAGLNQAVAEKARLVRRLNDILGDLNAELELEVVLDRITGALIELTGADAAGFVSIDGDKLTLVAAHGLPPHMLGTQVELRSSLVGEILSSGRSVLLASGERVDDLIWQELEGLHTVALTLANLGNRPYGALYALFAERPAGPTELELLELLAGHAGVAVGNVVAYQEVVRQRAHERAVIDSSADGIAVVDANGLVCQWNPAATRITGLDHMHAIGEPPPFEFEIGGTVTCQLPSGTWIDVLCAKIEETGELVLDFRDITAAKELEEAKDLFLATTSHELRTPITVVRGFAETLVNRWEELPDAQRRQAIGMIAERARSLGRLVEHLLLGSRAGADDVAVAVEEFDLGALLLRIVPAFTALSELHRLEGDVPDGLPDARADPMATDVIIGQLLENAVKYSPDGGLVRVTVAPGRDALAGHLIVTVDDEGIGIPEADRERVFERFVQGETGDRRRFGGVGLGLFIVKRLATAQGGDVLAEAAPGGGARLRLMIPRADAG
ncbi:ATP-binding protein [Actinocorallia longicatena]|uniref:histidine kinase n=1 Tax=Actinocorallia longicatena TaxID=111803 RepID=A0ABP6QCM0_9ACTN